MKWFRIALADRSDGTHIAEAATVLVATAGEQAKATLLNADGSSLANPITSDSGGTIEFYTADSVTSVDLYGVTATGFDFQKYGVIAGAETELYVDQDNLNRVMVIPFDADDYTAASEGDTGFDVTTDMVLCAYPWVKVIDIDTGETADIGTDGGAGDDPDGLFDGVSVATAGTVVASNETGVDVLGNLLLRDALAHDYAPASAGSVTLTLSAGSDTAAGLIHLPYRLSRT